MPVEPAPLISPACAGNLCLPRSREATVLKNPEKILKILKFLKKCPENPDFSVAAGHPLIFYIAIFTHD